MCFVTIDGGNMKDEILAVFEILKDLEIKPTPNNVRIMDAVYNSLRKVYQEMGEKENARATSDSE